jgi:hypothetical protein
MRRGEVPFVGGSAFALNFRDGFHCVLFCEVIEHVAHPDEFIANITANEHQNLILQSGTQLSDRVPADREKNSIGNTPQPSASMPEPARLGLDPQAPPDIPIF